MKIIVKATGEIKVAIYATTSAGHKRMNVDGKFYTDKQFDKLFEIIKEDAKDNRGLGLFDHSCTSDNGYEDY